MLRRKQHIECHLQACSMLAAHVRDAEIALVIAAIRAYRGEENKLELTGTTK